jgi:hypothetical protein
VADSPELQVDGEVLQANGKDLFEFTFGGTAGLLYWRRFGSIALCMARPVPFLY